MNDEFLQQKDKHTEVIQVIEDELDQILAEEPESGKVNDETTGNRAGEFLPPIERARRNTHGFNIREEI